MEVGKGNLIGEEREYGEIVDTKLEGENEFEDEEEDILEEMTIEKS